MATSFLPQNSPATPVPETTDIDFFGVEPTLASASSVEAPVVIESETPPEQEPSFVTEQNFEPTLQNESVSPKKKSTLTHPHPSTLAPQKDTLTAQIEKIMEEGISEAYQELTPIQKQEFKIKGEETAKHIKLFLAVTKVKIKKIFQILLDWLQLLPGVNKFYLMQEAKIKTDKILALKEFSL